MMDAMTYAVVLGEALVDLLDTDHGGERVYRPAIGGAPLNVAVGIARLGAASGVRAELIGSLGDDALAGRIHDFLVEAGVGTGGLVRVNAATTLAVTTFDGTEPSFRFYGQPPSYGLYGPADVDRAMVSGAAALYCGSICLLCEPVLAAARRAWATSGPLRAFDPNVRPQLLTDPAGLRGVLEEFAATADLVKLSLADANLLYPGDSASMVAERLLKLGPGRDPFGKAVVVTLGAEGAMVFTGDQSATVAAPRVRAVDATGAGDAVMAALVYGLVADGVPADLDGWRDRVIFATQVAGMVCEAPGGANAMPTLAEVHRRFPATS
jgi:fructokinase